MKQTKEIKNGEREKGRRNERKRKATIKEQNEKWVRRNFFSRNIRKQ